jgi:hypothetical protein
LIKNLIALALLGGPILWAFVPDRKDAFILLTIIRNAILVVVTASI